MIVGHDEGVSAGRELSKDGFGNRNGVNGEGTASIPKHGQAVLGQLEAMRRSDQGGLVGISIHGQVHFQRAMQADR